MASESDHAIDWNDLDAITFVQAAIETLPSSILLIGPGGSIAIVNREAEQLFGYSREQLIGLPLERLVPEAHGTAWPDATAGTGTEHTAPLDRLTRAVGVRRDESRFEIELHVRPIPTPTMTAAMVEIHAAPADAPGERGGDSADTRPMRSGIIAADRVVSSQAARRVMEMIEQVAPTASTVLLLGETGTGKELFASQIHQQSTRQQRPMIRVNCAAIPSTLIESELFGREKGAFTGALARQVGRFELADKGTIFLDEIGDLPLDVQVKLLRVLEEGQIERLGSPRSIHVDTRIIAATHQDLMQRIADGAFREDLYYRLNVFPIRVPALRERAEDIPHLVWQFVAEFSKAFGRRIDSISSDSMTALQQYPWPGNIRELRNTVERAMIVSTGPRLTIAPPPASSTATRRSLKLADVEKQHLHAVLESTHWRIRGEAGAAARLGLKPTTLETRMARLGLKRPAHR
jgi:PAS domain S-box-containing protein